MNEYVEQKVGLPGLALMAIGVLALVGNLVVALVQLVLSNPFALLQFGADPNVWTGWMLSSGVYILAAFAAVLWSPVVILAGARLRSARSVSLVYFGAFLAACPCCVNYCCCFGLPVAVWAIMALQDEQVRAAFEEG